MITSCKDENQNTQESQNKTEEKAPVKAVKLVVEETKDFHFPVGKPDAKGYYNAQAFGKNNHLGDDWNGTGGGNTDLGDPVFSIGNGKIISAKNEGGGWGNVIRIIHQQDQVYYESIYAHLDTIFVKKHEQIKIGTKIGTIGTADGSYLAHLHLEIRDSIHMDLGPGYSSDTRGYLDPTLFINTH